MSDQNQGSALDHIASALSSQEVSEEVVESEASESEDSEVSEESDSEESFSSEDSENGSEEVEVKAETEEELEKELQEAADAGATKEELTNMVRQFTLKVNNKEYVKEIDLGDEEAIKRELQMALAGRQAMQQSAELKKAYERDIERLRENPWEVIEELGLDPIQLAARRIEEHLAQNSKSPKEIEDERRAKEYEQLKAENERLRREFEEKARQAEMSKVEKEIETDIITALDSDPDLEANPEVINMVVDNMLWAMQNGFSDVTAKDVIPTVKKEIQRKYRAYAQSMKSPTALKALLGDDILNGLREERVENLKKQVNNISSIKKTVAPEKKEESPKKRVSLSEFMGGR